MDKQATDRTNIFTDPGSEDNSFADPFSFSAKSNTVRTGEKLKKTFRQIKKTTLPRHPKILEREELLAISELRYKTELKRIKHVIAKNKRINLLMVLSFIARVKPLIEITHKSICKTYLARWKMLCNYRTGVNQRVIKGVIRRFAMSRKASWSMRSLSSEKMELAYLTQRSIPSHQLNICNLKIRDSLRRW